METKEHRIRKRLLLRQQSFLLLTYLFCGENRKTDQSSLVSHQSGLYASNIF